MVGLRNIPLKFQNVELVKDPPPLEPEADHALVEVPFLGGSIARGVEEKLALVASGVEDGKLGSWRRRCAAYTP